MTFQKALSGALITEDSLKEMILSEGTLNTLPTPATIAESLAYIHAYANICTSNYYYYELSNLDSFCLICTQDGEGSLALNNQNYIMKHGTLAFVDCNLQHRVEIKKSPWIYKIFYISGALIKSFYDSFVDESGNLHHFLPNSSIPVKIEMLYDFLTNAPDNLLLIHSKYICEILFELLIERSKFHESHFAMCDYIYKIKHDFDCKYTDNITLEALERKYHISKYHICREFIKRFHMSPIKYLNYKKIEAAKEALLNTDKKVVEIGRLVGFENPNNFIRNFKKVTGMTPLEYRKQFYK